MMAIFGRRSHMKWPTAEIHGTAGRSDIKVVTAKQLDHLMAKAADTPWSAVGRPHWVRSHRDRLDLALLTIFGTEQPSAYRCLVTAILDDGTGGSFTLDVATGDFNNLPDVTPKTLVTLAHRYLLTFPPIDLDPDQAESWSWRQPGDPE
jgi:hypothetical protein